MAHIQLSNLSNFLQVKLWRINTSELPIHKRIFYNALKIVILTIRQFDTDHIIDKAATITYTTLFSIIPILALLFGIAKGFGFSGILEEQLRESGGIASYQSETIISLINSYLQHAQSGIFIGAGIIMLFVSVYFLTNAIEQNINAIWQAKKPRNILRMITDYFSMLLLIPVLMVTTSGITILMSTYMKDIDEIIILAPLMHTFIQLLPYIITCLIFIGIYIFVPNTTVKFRHVIIPGILAGCAFQAFQYFYISSQIWISNYNAIYGSFAAIPLFLFWANISWVICLIGVEMSYLSQNLSSFSYNLDINNLSRKYHDYTATLILAEICKQFDREKEPYSAEDISRILELPIRLTKSILYEMVDAKLLYRTNSANNKQTYTRYIPAISPHRLTVGMLLIRLNNNGDDGHLPCLHDRCKKLCTLNEKIEADLIKHDVLLKNL